eukprot:GHRQ01016634.1.p1 GENE.GHRQ01016634.1~~GHRQ01016634.1.p1  ORF type:complete len:271 (+),score=88.41 GHRQ01016634.1:973-1785(+)
MAQPMETEAGTAGQAQQELASCMDKDAALPAEHERYLNTSNCNDNDVKPAVPAPPLGQGLLLGLKTPTKLYPPYASSSTAGSRGNSFTQCRALCSKATQKPSLEPFSTMPQMLATKPGSIASCQHVSDASSTAAMHTQTQQLAAHQLAAAVAAWQPPLGKAAASPAACYTPNVTSTSPCCAHSRPLQLHKQQERDRNTGVLLMEKRLVQLSQALEEAQALQEQYSQQLTDADAAHKQRISNMQVGGASLCNRWLPRIPTARQALQAATVK